MIFGDWLLNVFHIILTVGLVLYLYNLHKLSE